MFSLVNFIVKVYVYKCLSLPLAHSLAGKTTGLLITKHSTMWHMLIIPLGVFIHPIHSFNKLKAAITHQLHTNPSSKG